jgi:hypothetical protein
LTFPAKGPYAISRRAAQTTQTEKGGRHFRHEIAMLESRARLLRFVVRWL